MSTLQLKIEVELPFSKIECLVELNNILFAFVVNETHIFVFNFQE